MKKLILILLTLPIWVFGSYYKGKVLYYHERLLDTTILIQSNQIPLEKGMHGIFVNTEHAEHDYPYNKHGKKCYVFILGKQMTFWELTQEEYNSLLKHSHEVKSPKTTPNIRK